MTGYATGDLHVAPCTALGVCKTPTMSPSQMGPVEEPPTPINGDAKDDHTNDTPLAADAEHPYADATLQHPAVEELAHEDADTPDAGSAENGPAKWNNNKPVLTARKVCVFCV